MEPKQYDLLTLISDYQIPLIWRLIFQVSIDSQDTTFSVLKNTSIEDHWAIVCNAKLKTSGTLGEIQKYWTENVEKLFAEIPMDFLNMSL